MLWIKTLHIFFVVCWFAGLFYLPRIFVNLALVNPTSTAEYELLISMATRLLRFMRWLMIGTIVFGLILWLHYRIGFGQAWMHAKLTVVALLVGYHHYCARLLRQFAQHKNTKSPIWYRWFNEIPVVLLLAAVFLVVLKPF